MVKLTAELMEQAAQYTNAVRDRELDLRGYKIPVIENLGATLDQFDAIDFSDNEIRKLDGFPLLRRLKALLVNNNRIWVTWTRWRRSSRLRRPVTVSPSQEPLPGLDLNTLRTGMLPGNELEKVRRELPGLRGGPHASPTPPAAMRRRPVRW
ncbi:U2 small nuclear ribonucleoprotein A'-like isoform X2 [Myotis myotis]|uniref:U2 small nuclear ribonucleoprotein A'-like isoform X2 n=1 Tax=Myotis myotis TaxID=51298 RepID=UPI00174E6B93|nr:U2 small nuclear ribonucleoprotein A'-like isoform X2 [Myotis myotis]